MPLSGNWPGSSHGIMPASRAPTRDGGTHDADQRSTEIAVELRDDRATVEAVLAGVWPAVEAGEVRPVVDRVLPLDQVAEAHRVLEASEHVGKVVLQVQPG